METTDINELMVSRLIGLISREGGHKAVAQALGASDEYLRQITRRYALPSGKTNEGMHGSSKTVAQPVLIR